MAHETDGLSRFSTAATRIQSLGSRIQEGTKGAVVQAKHAAKAVRAQAAKVDKKIRAKPYHSMGIAAGAGLIAGYLISRRRSRAS
jgi:ElaB/YqjD/DUF883 family membrane-anchored ribosome-binding protein